jgi:hypothetical protein
VLNLRTVRTYKMPAELLDRTIACLEDQVKALEAENVALKAKNGVVTGAMSTQAVSSK